MFRPLGDHALIAVDKPVEQTKEGILIAKDAQEPPHSGTVLAAGPKSSLARGERVLYQSYEGTVLPHDVVQMPEGPTYLLICDYAVIGVMD